MGESESGALVVEIHDVVHERWIPVVHASPDFQSGILQPFAGRRGDPSPYALNYPYDQVLLTNLLANSGVVVLHAASVIIDGKGITFGGRSGIGKTTLSRLCRDAGAILLNDDRCALYFRDGVPWVCPTPWHGEEPEINNQHAPLAAILHLDQGPGNQLAPLDEVSALSSLLATGIAPFYRKDGLEKVLDSMERVLAHIPSYRYTFAPTPTAVEPLLSPENLKVR